MQQQQQQKTREIIKFYDDLNQMEWQEIILFDWMRTKMGQICKIVSWKGNQTQFCPAFDERNCKSRMKSTTYKL